MRQSLRLADFGTIITGKTPSFQNPEHFGESYPFITPTDIDGNRTVETERRISDEGAIKFTRQMLPMRSVCFVCIGATIGKICMTTGLSLTNQQINSIVVDKAKHDPFFVYYLLSAYADKVKSIAGGVATPIVNKTAFENIEVLAPPLPIQRKIASILSAYDDLIENNLRRIKILEEMAKTIYEEWFVKFRFPGHEKVKMIESELGLIPEGWEVGKLKDIISNVRKSVKAGEELNNMPYVPIDLIPRKSLALTESLPGYEAKSSLIIFKERDILFGAMRSYFHKVIIAPFDGVTRSTCFVLRPVQNEFYSFAVLTLFEDKTVDYSHQHSRGSTMPYAVWDGSFAEMPIIKPPKDLLIKFNKTVKPMLEKIKLFYFHYNNLRQTRDFLLPKLISGEIDVENLDIQTGGFDEPDI